MYCQACSQGSQAQTQQTGCTHVAVALRIILAVERVGRRISVCKAEVVLLWNAVLRLIMDSKDKSDQGNKTAAVTCKRSACEPMTFIATLTSKHTALQLLVHIKVWVEIQALGVPSTQRYLLESNLPGRWATRLESLRRNVLVKILCKGRQRVYSREERRLLSLRQHRLWHKPDLTMHARTHRNLSLPIHRPDD